MNASEIHPFHCELDVTLTELSKVISQVFQSVVNVLY